MTITAAPHRTPLLLFVGVVIGVYATALMVAGRLPGLEGARAVAVGATLDMVVLVPLAFYFLVVRRRRLSPVTLIPVLVLSVLAAAQVLPSDHQQSLRILEFMAFPLELGLIAWVVRRAVRAVRGARRDMSSDPLEQLRRAALDFMHHDRLAGMFASEIAVFHYAIGGWRARPHVPQDTLPFTHHIRSGQGGIVLGFLLLLLIEGFAVHFLLLSWSRVAAWIFTLGTAYGALWVIADYRATILRPILISEDTVLFRAGLRWTVKVPRERIVEVHRENPVDKKESLKLTLFGAPTHWVSLSEPTLGHGPYGLRKSVRAIGLEPDEATDFERELSSPPGRSGEASEPGEVGPPPLQ